MKKCKKCGAPLEGFLYKTIGKLMGIKPSEKNPEECNKCEETPASKTEQKEEIQVQPKSEEKAEETAQAEIKPEKQE